MEEDRLKIRRLLLSCYERGLKASKARKEICAQHGENAISERQCQNWYARFKIGNKNLLDQNRSGRPSKLKEVENDVKNIIEKNPNVTTRALAKMVNISAGSASRHLQKLGYSQRQKVNSQERYNKRLLLDDNATEVNEQMNDDDASSGKEFDVEIKIEIARNERE